MHSYKYKALNKAGNKVLETCTAESKKDVLDMLKNKGYYPIYIRELQKNKYIARIKFLNRVRIKDIVIFCRQFYTMFNAGINIPDCLETISLQIQNKRFKKIIKEIYNDVQKGSTFSDSLKGFKKYFPDLLIYMVMVGETSGTLDIIMERLAIYYEKENQINNKIKTALFYPILLSITTIVIFIFILNFVIPTFEEIYRESNIQLPLLTQMMLKFHLVFKQYWHIIFIIFLLVAYGINRYIKKASGKILYHKFKLNMPGIKKLTDKTISSRFTRTLSTLLSSGITLIQALDTIAPILGNIVIEQKLNIAKEKIRRGNSLTNSIQNVGIFSPMVISMIRVGEEAGKLDEILDKTADFYDNELEASLKQFTSLFEPIIIVLVSIFIGFIIIAVMLPILDMPGTIIY